MGTNFKVGDKIRLKKGIEHGVVSHDMILEIESIDYNKEFLYTTYRLKSAKQNERFMWFIWDKNDDYYTEIEKVKNYELAERKVLKLKDFMN